MKLPIQYALFYPNRRYLSGDRLDFSILNQITFEKPDMDTFEGLKLAYEVGREGGSLPTVFNAANEYAVDYFLKGRIAFLEIYEMIKSCLSAHTKIEKPSVEDILNTQSWVEDYIKSRYK